MRSLLTAILCFAAAATASATETPSKFTGRWVGIAEFGNSRYPDMNDERALLTIEVDPQGVITNGAIRDFVGNALAGFFGQLDSNGRINTTTIPVQWGEGSVFGRLEINLGHTTGFGTYRARIFDSGNFRSNIRFWRENRPPLETATASSSSFMSFMSVPPLGNNGITNIVMPLSPPAAPNP
jgi:hypothetical protein